MSFLTQRELNEMEMNEKEAEGVTTASMWFIVDPGTEGPRNDP